MKKRVRRILMVVAAIMILCGCGKEGSNERSESQNTENETTEDSVQKDLDRPPFERVAWSEEMEEIRTNIVEALGEHYWPNMQVSPETLESEYGISSDLYEDYLAETFLVPVNVDTLIVIKAKEGKAKSVEDAMASYRENLVKDGTKDLRNFGKIQASRIERIGDYVCFVQLGGNTTNAEEQGKDAVVTQCLDQNELVIAVIEQIV